VANVNQFNNALDDLFRKRTYKLRSKIGSKILGQPPKITRKFIKKEILNLQEIASHVLANKLVKTEFKKHTHKKKAWHVKGHGVDGKKEVFEKVVFMCFGETRSASMWEGQAVVEADPRIISRYIGLKT
jgi:hypothetical protein